MLQLSGTCCFDPPSKNIFPRLQLHDLNSLDDFCDKLDSLVAAFRCSQHVGLQRAHDFLLEGQNAYKDRPPQLHVQQYSGNDRLQRRGPAVHPHPVHHFHRAAVRGL